MAAIVASGFIPFSPSSQFFRSPMALAMFSQPCLLNHSPLQLFFVAALFSPWFLHGKGPSPHCCLRLPSPMLPFCFHGFNILSLVSRTRLPVRFIQ